MELSAVKHQIVAPLITTTILAGSLFLLPPVYAAGFIDDSALTGGLYYWQRQRDRKEMDPSSEEYKKYCTNLSHSTFNTQLDFSSGYAEEWFGIDLGGYAAWKVSSNSKAHPDEISFSKGDNTWEEAGQGDKSGLSFYKAAVKLKAGDYWLRAGYLQPTGQTLLAPHWSFLPGSYRGAEAGTMFDYGSSGALSFSYMWADQYKAPWHQSMSRLRQADKKTRVRYLHSLGAKYDFKNALLLEGAIGQSQNYVNQYFGKISYQLPLLENNLRTSYQFYGAEDRVSNNSASSIYSGLAWLQALTFGYETGSFDWRLEGSWVKAEGKQGYFLQRMTPSYSSSNGRLDIWWDSRSDFNANGEKAIYMGVSYDLKNWQLAGWSLGTSYAYGWDAKPASTAQDQQQRVRESALNFDIAYTILEGKAKDTTFKLHHTRYKNHSSNPSWSNGYGNMFQSEKDVKFIVSVPFEVF